MYNPHKLLSLGSALNRHPKASSRPSFTEVRGELSLPDPAILQLNEEDKTDNSDAFKLGSELEAAQDLYLDLQQTYTSTK